MKKLFTGIATVFTVLLLNTFGLALHASAMPMANAGMAGMDHGSSSSTNCATLCRTAVFSKEELANSRIDEEEDDEAALPFYAQNQDLRFNNTVIKQKLYADVVKPPPKIPIYILYAVFRV